MRLTCADVGVIDEEHSATGCAAFDKEQAPREPSSNPLSPETRCRANTNFNLYWSRHSDGAPFRYSDTNCWHPGVEAAVVSTVSQAQAEGSSVSAALILTFMRE